MIVHKTATISPCGLYRYTLGRELSDGHGAVLFVLNNPSTADARTDDPTVRRGVGYAEMWGYRKLWFANANPFRSTDPRAAAVPPRHALRRNDACLRQLAGAAELVVAAWGTKAEEALAQRALFVLLGVADVYALAFTGNGRPGHILYLPGELQPQLWRRRGSHLQRMRA